MKIKIIYLAIALSLSFGSAAHEQEKHSVLSSESSCEAVLKQDHTDIEMNDPVTQAMLEKCQSAKEKNDDKKPEIEENHHEKSETQHH